jgi:nucleoside-diphosphate kinase
VKRGIVGEIFSRFERKGLKLVNMKMDQPTEEIWYAHYETIGTMKTRWGEEAYQNNLKYMMSGPVIICAFEGVDATKVIRQVVGATIPQESLPGTIRFDYAHTSREWVNSQGKPLCTIVHASGNREEGIDEFNLHFQGKKFSYPRSGEEFII